jgi:hypothetical protein
VILGSRRVLKREKGLKGGHAVASKPRISNGQGEHPCDKNVHAAGRRYDRRRSRQLCDGEPRADDVGARARSKRGAVGVRDKAGRLTASLHVKTHLNPDLLFCVAGIVLALAATVNGLALAGRRAIVDRVGRGSLPVLHLEGGRMRQRRRSGNRHQKRPRAGCEKLREMQNGANGRRKEKRLDRSASATTTKRLREDERACGFGALKERREEPGLMSVRVDQARPFRRLRMALNRFGSSDCLLAKPQLVARLHIAGCLSSDDIFRADLFTKQTPVSLVAVGSLTAIPRSRDNKEGFQTHRIIAFAF